MKNRIGVSFLLAAGAAFAGGPAISSEIGSVAAVNRDIDATPPGAPTRSLLIGDRLIANERLVSSADGSGQMLFLDQTTLTVSPSSSIVLDKYVYDPETQTGEIGVTLTRGVLRVIGGRITKTNDAVIRTPTATIGIRGGISLISVENGRTRVMHVAGEYSRITSGGRTLTLSRSNALATVNDGEEPSFDGVASDDDVAAIYDQMQGGGGGARRQVTQATAEAETGVVAENNSEKPGAPTAPPISTSGESPANDRSSEEKQTNLASDDEIQQDVQEDVIEEELVLVPNPDPNPDPTPDVIPDPNPDPDPEPEANPNPDPNPDPDPGPDGDARFADYVGGLITVSPGFGFTDDFGDVIDDAVAQNFLSAGDGPIFDSVRAGSIIGVVDGGGEAEFPAPETAGFFTFGEAETSSPFGPSTGSGFADPFNDFFVYYFLPSSGGLGFAAFGEVGPTQLRGENVGEANFRITPYRVLQDLHTVVSPTIGATAAPFLPAPLTTEFPTSAPSNIFMITLPGAETFGAGFGQTSFTGTRTLLPVFSLSGTDTNQRYLLNVGASAVLNNGDDAPALTLFTRGSFKAPGDVTATRVQSSVGSIQLETPDGDISVFGSNDSYFILNNEGVYFGEVEDPEAEVAVSFTGNIETGAFDAYGNVHVAQRTPASFIDPTLRIGVGATPSAFVAETGLADAAVLFAENEARFLSYGYASNAATLVGSGLNERLLLRTSGFGDSVTAGFSTPDAEGALVMRLDEIQSFSGGSPSIFAVDLAFGGSRSAVIDDERFGFREHDDPAALGNVLAPPGFAGNLVETIAGPTTGRAPGPNGERAFRGALLSHALADSSAIFPTATSTTPEYLRWGWWTGQFRFAETDMAPFDDARLQYSLGTWVAGDRTDILPTVGFATFDGAVVVNGVQAGVDFVDGGRFNLQWDFGDRVGEAAFEDVLDLPVFTVTVEESFALSSANDYSGFASVSGPSGFNSVQVDGSFFDGPTPNDALATAGSLRIDGPAGPRATGIFFAER